MDMTTAVLTLDALANDTRLAVFRLLVQAGPAGMAAGDIAVEMDALQNTMSSHLNKLARAGIVSTERDGRHIIYRANYAVLSSLILYLMEDCCGRTAELCAPIAAAIKC